MLRSTHRNPNAIKLLLHLTILRLQIRNALLVCYIGLLKLRNSVMQFRYCFWFFIHNLVLGYGLKNDSPPNE